MRSAEIGPRRVMIDLHSEITAAIWRSGKSTIAEFVPRIDDLDADRARIDIGLAGPGRHAGVPGAPLLRHALHDAAVLEHHVMRRHFALRRAQPLERRFAGPHAGVVQQDHVGLAPELAFVVIGRGLDLGDDEGIRLKDDMGRSRTFGGVRCGAASFTARAKKQYAQIRAARAKLHDRPDRDPCLGEIDAIAGDRSACHCSGGSLPPRSGLPLGADPVVVACRG